MSSTKRCWIGGNFKAAATKSTVASQVDVLNKMGDLPARGEVVIIPSALHIDFVRASVRPDVGVAIQDVHTAKGLGAFTGSHTVEQVKDFGLGWVLVGHSERRTIWKETDAETAAKTKLVIDAGLKAIVCIGETLGEREAGQTLDVCFRQLKAVVDILAETPGAWANIVVAYEPVWAIGTGKVATKEQAQEVHAALRAWVGTNVNAEVAEALRIVYGGSVSAGNCVSLITEKDIDGFLVGGASLKPEFADIVRCAASKA